MPGRASIPWKLFITMLWWWRISPFAALGDGSITVSYTHLDVYKRQIIKRVIATEGQTVDIDFEKGLVLVDGEPLDESAYIENGITTQYSDFTFPMEVPEGCVFVLGDNRPVSKDSRSKDVGMVDERYILGKAEWIVFPFDRFGKIE